MKRKKWEYIHLSLKDELDKVSNELNELGEDGWELVSVIDRKGNQSSWNILFLKREM